MASVIKLSDNSTVLENVMSTTYQECLNSGVDLRPGCVGSMMLEVEVYNTQANAVSAGDKLYYYQLDTEDAETLIGVFYAEPIISTRNSYKFVAYDAAQKLTADFSEWLRANQASFPMTVKQLVQAACTVAGVTLGSTSWTTSGQSVQAFYADGLTCRDIVSYAAELAGRYAHVHEDELLYFHWYTSTPNKRICPTDGTSGSETQYAYKQDSLQYANYTVPAIDGVAVHPSGEDDVAYIYPATPSGSNLLHIKNNLLLTGASAAFYNLVAQTVYTQMTAAALGTNGAYVPMTVSLFPRENPYEAGEIVDVTDSQGVSFRSIIMSRIITDSEVKLESTGNEAQGDGGNTQKAIAQLASDVVRINKLKVDWAEINTAIINYLTANDVTAQNLTIVDANDNVLATFNANGITLGQTDDTHAEIDSNSFELFDKNGNKYLSVGDLRDSSGYANIIGRFVGDGDTSTFTLNFTPHTIQSVEVNDSQFTGTWTVSGRNITLSPTPSANDSITVNYTTSNRVYHYDLGNRVSGYAIGAWSLALGNNAVAEGDYSAVLGGSNNNTTRTCSTVCGGGRNSALADYATVGGGKGNTASAESSSIGGGYSNSTSSGYGTTISGGGYNSAVGQYSAICGGYRNAADGRYATVVGGSNNTASGSRAFVGCGDDNVASGDGSAIINGVSNTASGTGAAVLGGARHTASGIYSTVVGGDGNTASGIYSSALNGQGCKATGGYQVVFGRYNTTDATKAEIVGNGTLDSARSNARTLDWNGNEVLAGTLTATGADFSGTVKVGYGGSGMFFQKTLPAVWTAGTSYYAFRGVDANGNGRGGLQFYRSSSNGDGCRMSVSNGNAVSNILALYVNDSDQRIVAVSDKSAWQKGLGMVYVAGDSVTLGTTGTNGYVQFAGGFRTNKILMFTVPLSKPIASGVTVTASGQVIVYGVNNSDGYAQVNVTGTDRTTTIYTSDTGVTIRIVWNTAPTWAVTQAPVGVQSYNLTLTFSAST